MMMSRNCVTSGKMKRLALCKLGNLHAFLLFAAFKKRKKQKAINLAFRTTIKVSKQFRTRSGLT